MTGGVRVAVLTVSDRAAAGVYEDRGGPAAVAFLRAALGADAEPVRRLVPDERRAIEAALVELCDGAGCHLVVTTGGTGPAPRDVTPEATLAVCEREMPGFGEAMRAASLRSVPTAVLSRQTAGVRGTSLIVNLPGRPAAIAECLAAVMPAIPYCIELIGGPAVTTDPAVVRAFRPAPTARGGASP
jgi:molybdopterin adenylyltransferase